MNKEILDNLYELWEYIGRKTGGLIENGNFKSVSTNGSDWPSRVFSIATGEKILSDVIDLCRRKALPNRITAPKLSGLESHRCSELFLTQRNMLLKLKSAERSYKTHEFVKQVKTKEDSLIFAQIASDAFGYKVRENIIYPLSRDPSRIKAFRYTRDNESVGCGIIFFDSNNNAGLRMIGSAPHERGKGVGNAITESLLREAKLAGSGNCVLRASPMGENMYKKFGFVPFGEIETYLIH